MKQIEELSAYEFPDQKHIPDGYDLKTIPDISAKNIEVLMNKINEIIQVVNKQSTIFNKLSE